MPIRRSPNGARHVRPQPGRNRPERVVAVNRKAWSQSVGTGGRNHPVRAARSVTVTTGRPIPRSNTAQMSFRHRRPLTQETLVGRYCPMMEN